MPKPPRSVSPNTLVRGVGDVRIIGGSLKRSKLPVLQAPGLRPTPDRVRETLFNWLGQDLSGLQCVDAFAGSGALSVEAASRGAARVVSIERDAALAQHLSAQLQRLQVTQVTVVKGDALQIMAGLPSRAWGGVFLDPPFLLGQNQSLVHSALQAAARLLKPNGWVYLEAPQVWTDEALAPLGWRVHRHGKAGQVHYHVLTLLSPME